MASIDAAPEAMADLSRIKNELIQSMRDILGDGFCDMDLVHSLHLSRNDVQMAINILLDTPGFKNRSPVKNSSSTSNPRPKPSAPKVKNVVRHQPAVKTENQAGVSGVKREPQVHEDKEVRAHVKLEDQASSSTTNLGHVCEEKERLRPGAEVKKETSPTEKERLRSEVRGKIKTISTDAVTPQVSTLSLTHEGASSSSTNSSKLESQDDHGDWTDLPDDKKWWLLEETELVGYSTCRGCKIIMGDVVSFNFPKAQQSSDSRKLWSRAKQNSEIVRFATPASGEIGRLPADWAKCFIPLVHSNKITVRARCKSAPANLTLMSSIVLDLRIYINQSFFKKYKATVSLEETTFRPLPSLMQLLGKKPLRKAEFTPEDLNVYTRKRAPEESPAAKRPKVTTNDGEESEMDDAEVNHVIGTTDSRELQEMDEPEGLECKLRPYQKQALYWMSKLEVGVTREDAAKTLHPCWSEYSLADRRASSFYVNAFSGEATLDFPSAMQTARGGILADAMGLGKTVMTISLLLSNRGKGAPEQNTENIPKQSTLIKQPVKKGGGTLIICPMTLLGQWRAELQAHVSTGTFSVYAYYGQDRVKDAKFLSKYDVVLTTYGVVQSESNNNGEDGPIHLVHWFRVVLDEAHSIKATKSASAQAVFKLAADRRLCLTGTPVQNKLEDMYSLLYFLRVEPWCNWGWWHKLIQKPYEEGDERGLKLLQSILKPLMLRRTKDSTDKDGRPILVLPPAECAIIECELSEAERDFYDALYHKSKVKFDQFVEQGKVLHNYASILELLLRLRQTCDHPFLVLSRGDTDEFADLGKLAKRFLKNDTSGNAPSSAYVNEVVQDIRKGETVECPICLEVPEDAILTPCAHRMCRECLFNSWRTTGGGLCPICRQACGKQDLITVPTSSRFRIDVEEHWTESCKVRALLEQLQQLKHVKSVVFSQWTSFLDLLEIPFKRKGFHYVRLDGTLSQPQREQVLREFSSNASVSIMLLSLKAGGVGLNLTAACNAFLLDPWWNPAVEEQAIMRIHRIGQTKKVFVKRFIVKGTVEERMQQVQARKQRLIAGALTDEEVRNARIEELKMLFR